MAADTETSLSTQYPGIRFAYDLVAQSYTVIYARLGVMEDRLAGLITLALAAAFGAPSIVLALKLQANAISLPFLLACLLGFVSVAVAIYGRHHGRLSMIHPRILYDKWLHLSEYEFKKDMVYFAGENLDKNNSLVERKAFIINVVTVLLALQVACLVWWAVA